MNQETNESRSELLRRVRELKTPPKDDESVAAALIVNLKRHRKQLPESAIRLALEEIEQTQRAGKGMPAVKGGESAPTPPGTVATHQALLSKETESVGRDGLPGTADADWPHVDDRQLAREEQEKRTYRDLRRQTKKLDPDYVKVMSICLEDPDYTFEQIAEKAGLSKTTAWRYYRAAVQTLAVRMADTDPARLAEIARSTDYEATIAPLEQRKGEEIEDKAKEKIARLIPAAYDDRDAGELALNEMTRLLEPMRPHANVRPNWANQTDRPKYIRHVPDQWLSTRAVDAGPDDSEPQPVTSAGGARAPALVAARERRQRRHGPYPGDKIFSRENPPVTEDP